MSKKTGRPSKGRERHNITFNPKVWAMLKRSPYNRKLDEANLSKFIEQAAMEKLGFLRPKYYIGKRKVLDPLG